MKWKNKRVLVTGSEGMIGQELVIQLKQLGADVSRSDPKNTPYGDLRYLENCINKLDINEIEYVFHLAGIKGNPHMTKTKPVDFMGPMLQFDTNMIMASQGIVRKFLYTSSIAVENPDTDKYPAWAKQTAETLIEAMKIQYPTGTKYCIVRPSNVYGVEDLNRDNLMVVSNLIKKGLEDNRLILDNLGSQHIRDVIYSKDVARNMIKVMEEMPLFPVNLCSGKQYTIKQIAEIISEELEIPITYEDLNISLGNKKRVMSKNYPLDIKYDLRRGINEIINSKNGI